MPKPDGPLLPGHDGIHEYDNPIPAWMSSILGLTIAFGVVYMLYQHAGDGPTLQQEYDAALAENVRIQFAEIGTLKPDEPTILDYMGKPDWLAFGKTVYLTHCQSCHGPAALGNVGPNLCDDSWKHVEKLADIAKVVANGAAGAAMPAWGNRLHANEIVLVSAYVAALRGSGGGAGKAADGKPIPPWPAPPTAGGAKQGGKP